jgi:GNAT superfamily N-acetyltransferase
VIRAARSEDSETIRAIVDAAYRPYIPRIGRPPGPMLDDFSARVAAGQVWVLENSPGHIAGILVLEDQADAMLLDNVAVLPALHGKGIGRALIGFAEAEARRRGHRAIRLYTHVKMTENFLLYGCLGFVETARVTEKGFERVYMEKILPSSAAKP